MNRYDAISIGRAYGKLTGKNQYEDQYESCREVYRIFDWLVPELNGKVDSGMVKTIRIWQDHVEIFLCIDITKTLQER